MAIGIFPLFRCALMFVHKPSLEMYVQGGHTLFQNKHSINEIIIAL